MAEMAEYFLVKQTLYWKTETEGTNLGESKEGINKLPSPPALTTPSPQYSPPDLQVSESNSFISNSCQF